MCYACNDQDRKIKNLQRRYFFFIIGMVKEVLGKGILYVLVIVGYGGDDIGKGFFKEIYRNILY